MPKLVAEDQAGIASCTWHCDLGLENKVSQRRVNNRLVTFRIGSLESIGLSLEAPPRCGELLRGVVAEMVKVYYAHTSIGICPQSRTVLIGFRVTGHEIGNRDAIVDGYVGAGLTGLNKVKFTTHSNHIRLGWRRCLNTIACCKLALFTHCHTIRAAASFTH
jgi:hypothetical protein